MYTPKYTVSNKILRAIGSIEASREVITNAPMVPSYEKQFQSDAVLRTVHHGTHIEGNDLSIAQTKKILEGQEVFARERDIQEVINYRNAMTLLSELAVKRGGYTSEMLKDIQKITVERIVPEDKKGEFRKSQVVIKEEGTDKIVFSPPPAVEVPYLVDDFMEWLNSDTAREMHPIFRAAIAHYVLVAIHPFIEGNGRTVRAFATLILLREGYDIKKFFSLEERFDEDPAAYYEAFAKVDAQSKKIEERDLTPWIEYFTEVVAAELSKIKDKVKKLSIDTRLKLKMGEQVTLSERQVRLFEYLTDTGSGNMQELKTVLPMVSEDTILRDLTDMMEKGAIKKEGSTKASRYVVVR